MIVHNVVKSANAYGVDPRLELALIGQESRFNSHAVSRVGARGLGQLMPQTAARLGVRHSFDIGENINASTRLLSQLIHTYHGNVREALAAYNAGPAQVTRYGGVPPIPETQHYVETISYHYHNMRSSS